MHSHTPLTLNSDRTEGILVAATNSMCRNVDMNSVMLGNVPFKLSNSVSNLGFVLDNQLNLNEQIINVKRKLIVNLNVTSHTAKFIDKNSKMKLVQAQYCLQLNFATVYIMVYQVSYWSVSKC